WRYEHRSKKFGVHASLSFSNPWGHVFDYWGQNFIGDASPGFSYWAAPISGRVDYPQKHPGGSQHGRLAQQTGGGEGYGKKYRFPRFYKKRTRPLAGCAILSSRHFPDDVQGNFLVTNCIGDRMLLSHQVREEGSGFAGKEAEPIVVCSDGNFRPVDVQVAPDGSLHIVDWHNALIGHLQHNLRDPSRDHSHGRVWRVIHSKRPLLKPARIAGEPIPALLELLKLPEDRTRYRARRELAGRRSRDVIDATEAWLESVSDNDHLRLEALWIHQTHNVVNESLLKGLLNAKDHRARAAAVRVLSYWLDRVDSPLTLLKKGVNDKHARVRLESLRALSFLQGDDAIEVALGVLEHEMDDYLQYTLDQTMRRLEQ
ncbi:MAG: HEAT repeat domain-containing protein, partial [Planctomycetota bacterium]